MCILWFDTRQLTGATRKWEEILLENPTDLLALKFAHDTYFYLGCQQQMRDSIARVLPFWKADIPLYSYLYGMHAFGLVETNFHDQAEQNALKALELNPRDCWATHARAHVLEMRGQATEGIKFLCNTVEDWNKGHALACHNHWHWALYLIEKGEKEAALDIYDKEVGQRCKSGAMLDLVDAASLLYRLQLEGDIV
jgi:tetratricopeptide (TPR) repeat protein